jgi:hypothetical protein
LACAMGFVKHPLIGELKLFLAAFNNFPPEGRDSGAEALVGLLESLKPLDHAVIV